MASTSDAGARAWPPLRGLAWQDDGGLPVTVEAGAALLAARLYGTRGEPVVLLPHGPGAAPAIWRPWRARCRCGGAHCCWIRVARGNPQPRPEVQSRGLPG